MSDFPPPTWPLNAETAERCLDILARVIARDPDGGEVYLPIWKRLEYERDTRRERERMLDAAKARARRSTDRTAELSS